ncbi:TetR/AcrR family transcriptional regulator [Conexibacter sp. SYSU D00693]|uniref:TetR/AcrR family transcriptional regulator n=1 Tax=Conexibacter sp. SYSU D00693 TaxID=2812560 RepID=UPI00196ADB98|nr:TetR/AcrR family transcriptional regulator [Conexibacter sp. SYSU D00693]
MSAEPAQRPLRADAARNREAVLAAAEAVFADHGLDAGVPEVATRAGVGKATVYRSFPTKEHLVAAVVRARLARFEEETRAALAGDDAAEALRALLARAAERQARDRALAGALTAHLQLAELQEAKGRIRAGFEALLACGKAQGTIRADATARDLEVLYGGVTRVLLDDDERDPAAWRRAASLAVAALRAV